MISVIYQSLISLRTHTYISDISRFSLCAMLLTITGAAFADEDIDEVSYRVDFVDASAARHVNAGSDAAPSSQRIAMTASNGTKYDCILPDSSSAENSMEAAKVARRKLIGTVVPASKREALNQALGTFCAMRPSGWWVYEVCWGKHVRQYHADARNNIEAEYFLGLGPSAKKEKGATGELYYEESPVHGMYLVTHYFNGTECDITRDQRQTQVRLTCLEDDEIENGAAVLVDTIEVATCVYAMTVKHTALCTFPELKRLQRITRSIQCRQQLHDDDGT